MNLKIKNKNLKSSSKGITLIALVVTIIVLLILAGVTIATLVGDNGILTRANSASVAQIEGQVDEEVKLAVQSAKMYAEEMATRTEDGWLAEEQLEAVVGQMILYDLTGDKGYTVTRDDTAKTITVTYEKEEYKKAKNDTNAKIIIVITVTGNTFVIGEGQTSTDPVIPSEPDPTLPSGELPSIVGETTPYKPDEKSVVIDNSTLETGLVVKDGKNDEWVWIVVPKTIYTDPTYTVANNNTNVTSSTDIDGIYKVLNKYAVTYRKSYKDEWYDKYGTTYDGENEYSQVKYITSSSKFTEAQTYYGTVYTDNTGTTTATSYASGTTYYAKITDKLEDPSGCGLTYEKYNENYEKMLKSIFNNGGFWIGRYEAGIDGTTGAIVEGDTSISSLGRSSHKDISDTSPKAISQQDAIAYNYVYCSEAQKLASKMSPDSNKTSSLMFGIQWDLVCKYLEQNATELGTTPENRVAKINSNSGDWGNYNNVALTIDSSNAKQYSSSKWSAKTGEKAASTLLLSTGASTKTKVMNIYDFAGNEWEWTLEHSTADASYPCAGRGGNYSYSSSYPASRRSSGSTTTSSNSLSFRPALY